MLDSPSHPSIPSKINAPSNGERVAINGACIEHPIREEISLAGRKPFSREQDPDARKASFEKSLSGMALATGSSDGALLGKTGG
jgi:hypothetical protein